MLYVYRGILAPDYKEQAQVVVRKLKLQLAKENPQLYESITNKKKASTSSATSSGKNKSTSLPDSDADDNTSNDPTLNVSNLAFSVSPEFHIPYSTSPVSLNLSPSASISNPNTITNMPAPSVTDVKNVIKPTISTSRSGLEGTPKKRTSENNTASVGKITKKVKTMKSKSTTNSSSVSSAPSSTSISTTGAVSALNSRGGTSEPSYVTAAAAAPRISKLLPRNPYKTNSQMATGVVSALHNIIFTQTPIESPTPDSSNQLVINEPQDIDAADITVPSSALSSNPTTSWMKVVREGFLSQDIELSLIHI